MNKSALIIASILTFLTAGNLFGQATATYDITFTSIWNGTDHTSIPGGAHWSKLVGATHKSPNTFLQIGSVSSTGIKNIAETGNNSVFNAEVSSEISGGEADRYINGPSLSSATGNMMISDLVVSRDFPLVTLVSMIAPSPDWVIAINGFNLLDGNGDWKTAATIDMYAYDAGTDSGTDYNSSNVATNPFQPISMINGAPFNGNKIGTLTITLKTLSIRTNSTFEDVVIYPNPVSTGSITIQNISPSSFSTIEIFNVAGVQMKAIEQWSNGNTLTIDTQNYPSGMYLMRLSDLKNNALVRKFVVE